MDPQIQQQLQQLVHSSQEFFQKGIEHTQRGNFQKSSFFFNLSARENDKLSNLLKELVV